MSSVTGGSLVFNTERPTKVGTIAAPTTACVNATSGARSTW